MKMTTKLRKILVVCVLAIFVACTPQSNHQGQTENDQKSNKDLEKQSEDFSKSMDNLNEVMDLASQLNKQIQQVEKRFQDGEITREIADELIQALNQKYEKNLESTPMDSLKYAYPSWLLDIGINAPQGLVFDANNSFQTSESNMQDGYNSVLYIYHGDYSVAMKEAERIANTAGIPMSEIYRKAHELSKKLGKPIEGLKGMTFMNYKFGEKEFSKPYKISISVDENGKFILSVVDVQTKAERKKSGSNPIKH